MIALPKHESFIVELEQEVLGAIMVSNEFQRVSGVLRQEHFVEPLHAYLFEYMQSAFDRYGSVNPVIVFKLIPEEAARTWGAKIDMSLSAYLANLAANSINGPSHIERSAKKVIEQWARIRIGEEAQRLTLAASDPNSDPMQLVTTTGQTFDDIAAHVRAGPRRATRLVMAQAADNAFHSAEEARQRKGGLTGIKWGDRKSVV